MVNSLAGKFYGVRSHEKKKLLEEVEKDGRRGSPWMQRMNIN
jgi:predicted site-specific integrase-resolvase